MIAYCGLACPKYEAFIATQADDRTALEHVARWREAYSSLEITAESVVCDDCLAETGRHCNHCHECDIRICEFEHGVANCAHCPDYACDKLERFFGFVPDARRVLEQARHPNQP